MSLTGFFYIDLYIGLIIYLIRQGTWYGALVQLFFQSFCSSILQSQQQQPSQHATPLPLSQSHPVTKLQHCIKSFMYIFHIHKVGIVLPKIKRPKRGIVVQKCKGESQLDVPIQSDWFTNVSNGIYKKGGQMRQTEPSSTSTNFNQTSPGVHSQYQTLVKYLYTYPCFDIFIPILQIYDINFLSLCFFLPKVCIFLPLMSRQR